MNLLPKNVLVRESVPVIETVPVRSVREAELYLKFNFPFNFFEKPIK
jgi:hypothetical protein